MGLDQRTFKQHTCLCWRMNHAFAEKQEQTKKEKTRCKSWQIEQKITLSCLLFFAFFLLLLSLFFSQRLLLCTSHSQANSPTGNKGYEIISVYAHNFWFIQTRAKEGGTFG